MCGVATKLPKRMLRTIQYGLLKVKVIMASKTTEKAYKHPGECDKLLDEIANYRGWLQLIAELSLDRDGFKNADDLGMLVDDIRDLALAALDEEVSAIPADRKHGDKTLYPGTVIAGDESTVTIRLPPEWRKDHVIRLCAPCFVRGLSR